MTISVYGPNVEGGWLPLGQVQVALSQILGTEVTPRLGGRIARSKLTRGVNLIRGRAEGCEMGILLCPSPANLLEIYQIPQWRRRFKTLIAYVIDSWYHEWYSHEAKLFDHVFVSRQDDVAPVAARTRRPTHCLPLGADVVSLQKFNLIHSERPIDLLAYGRQPPGYGPREVADLACVHGLTFTTEVPMPPDPVANAENIYSAAGRSKFALGFCNTVHYYESLPKSTPFVTFRWVNNLAAGAVMVGRLPRPQGFERHVGWEGAYVDLPLAVEQGVAVLNDAKKAYELRIGLNNHYQSLVRNDWRLRLADVFERCHLSAPTAYLYEMDRFQTYQGALEGHLG